jgi:hypothetical protein
MGFFAPGFDRVFVPPGMNAARGLAIARVLTAQGVLRAKTCVGAFRGAPECGPRSVCALAMPSRVQSRKFAFANASVHDSIIFSSNARANDEARDRRGN